MLKPIRNRSDYASSLESAYQLMQKKLRKDSEEAAYLDALTILIAAYEKEHFPIEAPDPIDAILFRLDQMNLTKSDLKEYLGYRSRVSDILSGNRKLSLQMIRVLHEKLNIPAEVLIQDYKPKRNPGKKRRVKSVT